MDTQVELRVTLSYFIEPSPGERGCDCKYGYASHGLRFKVIRATETLQEFKLRIMRMVVKKITTMTTLVKQDAGTSVLLAQRMVLSIPIRGVGRQRS